MAETWNLTDRKVSDFNQSLFTRSPITVSANEWWSETLHWLEELKVLTVPEEQRRVRTGGRNRTF